MNVPLEKIIGIIIERLYDRKEIKSQITRPEMKKLQHYSRKNVHSAFDIEVYLYG